MCDNRDGKFVVPTRPGAAMGWWIGQILGREHRCFRINVMWVEVAECNGDSTIFSTPDYFVDFDSLEEAMDFLTSKGVDAFLPEASA